MAMNSDRSREILELLSAICDGRGDDSSHARLDELVQDDESAGDLIVEFSWLHTDLWRATLADRADEVLQNVIAAAHASEDGRELATSGRLLDGSVRWVLRGMCAAACLGVAVAVGMWINQLRQFPNAFPVVEERIGNNRDNARAEGIVAAKYEARLVQYTSCVWGQQLHPGISDGLRSGESLNLIYGLADLELRWPAGGTAKVRLEGPAGMVLMADGGVSLNHGKLTASYALEEDQFAVETPLGRIEVAAKGRVGVAVSPKSTAVHVFSGDAKVVTSWASDSESSDSLDIHAGQSVELVPSDTGTVQVRRGAAALDFFVTQIAMTDDLLGISDEYVATIKKAAPLCYWRFNAPVDGFIRNEMGDQYQGRVFGNTEWVEELGNWTIQCGGWFATDTVPSHIVADRPLQSVGVESYSLEVWVKPSHFHLGTIAALLKPNAELPGVHGLLLELGGPLAIQTGIEHPGRVRYLHRSPPEGQGGTSCFSSIAYGLRKWQHIVAVKDRSDMRLYIDGREVAKGEESTPLAEGLLLLIGQLDRERNARLFIGQLDELAYYERALTEQEIEHHFRLVRPKESALKGI